MRAHYKRSKHQITVAWFRLWLSPVFETASCVDAPSGEDPKIWSQMWTNPQTPAEARTAIRLCETKCPALPECRVLASLGPTPRSVVQAGRAYGIRVGKPSDVVASGSTPPTDDEDAAC